MKNYADMTMEELLEMKRRYVSIIDYFTEILKEDEFRLGIRRIDDAIVRCSIKQDKYYINDAKRQIEKIELQMRKFENNRKD